VAEKMTKSMTCAELGGPCDHRHHGRTADEVINAQDHHLKEMVAGGDAVHEPALKEMKGRWKRPISGLGWYREVKRRFAALPADGVVDAASADVPEPGSE
jgi:predicted small metal-binding protein